jgi:FAD:protein FMN transferase
MGSSMRLPPAALFASLALTQCGRESVRTHVWFSMSTSMSVSVYGDAQADDEAVFAKLESETDRLSGLLTDFSAASALSAVKGSVGDTLRIAGEVAEVLNIALQAGREGNGSFDITLHDLKWLWGLAAGQTGAVPDSAAIDSLLADNPVFRSGWDSAMYSPPVSLLPAGKAIVRRSGVQLDLGGVAKGYIVDRLHRLLDSLGRPDHIIQAGGDTRIGGRKTSGPWRIGIRNPRAADSLSGMITSAEAFSVSTSGDYERFFEKDGMRYHHIFDPRTGRPSRNAMAVTVIADSSVLADALSTSLFVLGPQRGPEVARRSGAKAVWFVQRPEGRCAILMEEMRPWLELKGLSACAEP